MMNRWINCVTALLVALVATTLAGGQSPVHKPKGSKNKPHWAFLPPLKPPIPKTANSAWVHNPIDAFVLAKFDAEKLKPLPPADRRTLLRRVYLDLIGLPPTPDEQKAFLEDSSPQAYARVVDNLLARPQYGERWARHWLDVVRYAESNGYERDDAKPSAWRYRDYVIDAFNKDMPYDRFVVEQLAGDEIDNANAASEIATTFLRLGTWDDEPAEPKVDRCDQLDDVLGTTCTAFLGLTLRCARCHNHKFEPLTQKDYYSMLAVFEPLTRPLKEREELDCPVGKPEEIKSYTQAHGKALARSTELNSQVHAIQMKVLDRLLPAEKSKPGKGKADQPKVDPVKPGQAKAGCLELPAKAVDAYRADPAKRTKEQKDLVTQFQNAVANAIRSEETSEERCKREELEKELAKVVWPKELPRAYIWQEETGKPRVTHVLHRGDPDKPREEVAPALPAVLVKEQPAGPTARPLTSGRRLWLARWLTSRANPLTARVLVNRLWREHFGEGLVTTPNDFGLMGDPPSYPELLDWLACEFMDSGWKIKDMHRLILLSNTYQMAAATEKSALPLGVRHHRLDAEAIRDSILAVSGQLNMQAGGPSVFPTLPRAVLDGQSRPGDGWGQSDERQASRRSVYIFVKRSLAVPELELLDSPDTTASCEQRLVSTTGPQALTFLNGEFTHAQARHFAARLVREAGGKSTEQVERAYQLALCRPLTTAEKKAALEFLETQRKQIEEDSKTAQKPKGDSQQRALEAFCLVLLNTNEFFYAD